MANIIVPIKLFYVRYLKLGNVITMIQLGVLGFDRQ